MSTLFLCMHLLWAAVSEQWLQKDIMSDELMICEQKWQMNSFSLFYLSLIVTVLEFPLASLYVILLNFFLQLGQEFSDFKAQSWMHSKQNLWLQLSILASLSGSISSIQIVHVSFYIFELIYASDCLFESTYYLNLLVYYLEFFF